MFLGEPARKARESQVEGEQNAARSQGVGVGRERRARGQGQGNVTEERTAQSCVVTLCSHLINRPFLKHDLYSSGPTQRSLPRCIATQILQELRTFWF